jgi:hypothetical protein
LFGVKPLLLPNPWNRIAWVALENGIGLAPVNPLSKFHGVMFVNRRPVWSV